MSHPSLPLCPQRHRLVLLALMIASCVTLLCSYAFPLVSPLDPTALAQSKKVRPDRCSSCPPPSERRIYAPVIELREAERCEIVLNSRSPNVVEVTPTFYRMNGHAVVGTPVQLQPAEIRFVPIEQLIPADLRGRQPWGGIALSYTGNVLEVWAQITFHGVGGNGSVDETFNILEETGSDTREAVWWMPKRSTAIIALGNSSNSPVRTTAQFSDGSSEEIDIAPYATKFLRRRSHDGQGDGSSNESVKFTTAGPEGSLRLTGFIIADDQSFTSSIRFHDTKRTVQPNLYATNLRLINTNARMVLKNTSDITVSGRPRFLSAAGEEGHPVELPAVTLSPGQIVDVDLSAVREAAASRTDFDSVSVQVMNSGTPGSLIGALYSAEETTQLAHDVPLRDSGKIRNATGSYPWRVDRDYSTVVVITNIGNQAARFQVEIRYLGGPYSVKQRELAIGETATFDLRRMRDEQQPDRVGKTLPLDLERGQFHWSLANTRGDPRIIGRAEVVSTSERVSSSYSCPTCCPDSGNGGVFDPNAYALYVNGSALTNGRGDYYDCYGNWYTGSLDFSFLWTNNTSVATINSSTEQLQGIGAGQTAVGGNYDFTVWDTDGMDCYSQYYNGSDSAPTDVFGQDVHYERVTFSNTSANFSPTFYSATLNIGGAVGGTNACSGGSNVFRIVVEFTLPMGADSIKHPDSRTFVTDSDSHQFQYLDFGFQNVSFSTRKGEMWIRLRRVRPSAPSDRIAINITGTSDDQIGVWSGGATIHLVCP